jgi:hypothetical protein
MAYTKRVCFASFFGFYGFRIKISLYVFFQIKIIKFRELYNLVKTQSVNSGKFLIFYILYYDSIF